MSIGKNLKFIRKEQNLTIRDLVQLSDVGKSTISDIENDNVNPTTATLEKLAKALNVSVNDFFHSSIDEKNKLKSDTEVELTNKDKKDIEKNLEKTLAQLEKEDGLMLSGNPVDADDWEFIKTAIKTGLEYAKKVNKEKYTPKKYKK
ncbi:helix-turn-helix domain-containing protein [Clostridium senegalense]|uniref:helix-turn-helix domain-containing protein n=1 Tax=Clostridium senegalense TaxID=1465809 RepID=UPI0002891E69|nr:helix-turn-helix transcriptional regulator [Clostridium senegalense]